MHIPDGYLSPETCAAGYLVMVPAWGLAARRVRRDMKTRHVPRIALAAAFSFLVMMFNVPVPGGTTAHAVGAALIALLLGPWAAVVAVSIALGIQALLFGDGGVLAFSINAFNMAWVMPWVAWGVNRALCAGAAPDGRRRRWAAGAAGYVSLGVAALCCAIELGIQPLLFHAANGAPLYSPYPLSQTIPAMLLAHLTVAGFAEAALTAGVIAYLRRAQPELLPAVRPSLDLVQPERRPKGEVEGSASPCDRDRPSHSALYEPSRSADPSTPALRANARGERVRVGRGGQSERGPMRTALVVFAGLIVASPLGLLAPGSAFGESAPTRLNLHTLGLSAIPTGLAHYYAFWGHALLDGYGLASLNPVLGYFISALVGTLTVGLATFAALWLVGRVRRRPVERPSEIT